MTLGWSEARAVALATGRERLAAAETVPLTRAVARVLAAAVVSHVDLPGVDTSAMDGWAVAGPGPWLLEGEIAIGSAPPASALAPGTARPIATGAPVPPGEVAILRRERGEVRAGVLTLAADAAAPPPGSDIRRRGEEVTAGERILEAGRTVTPPAAALAAACGLDELAVRVPPTVDVLVLGREVLASGVPVPGRVRDALGTQLPAVLAGLGARCGAPLLVGDGLETVRDAIDASTADLLVTTGGTAEGPTDVMRSVLADFRLVVDRVAMRPGRPALLAVRADGRPVLALPGNPFAALTAALSIAAPLLDGMLGRSPVAPPLATAGVGIPNDRPGVRIVVARGSEAGIVPVAVQGAGSIRGAAEADAFAVVPEGGVRAGDPLALLPLPW